MAVKVVRLLLIPIALLACAHGDDGFRARVMLGCATEGQCETLGIEARGRLHGCEVNGEHCDEQRYDAQFVDTQLAAWKSARELASRSRDVSDLGAAKATCDDEVAGLKSNIERKDKRAKALLDTIDLCVASNDSSACASLGDDARSCRDWCAARVNDARTRLYDVAVTECVLAQGTTCAFSTANVDRFITPADRVRCASDCTQRVAANKPTVVQSHAVAQPPRSSVRQTSAGSGAGGGSGTVRCCDGTNSPTCTYVHQGCCSHHGGVCGP